MCALILSVMLVAVSVTVPCDTVYAASGDDSEVVTDRMILVIISLFASVLFLAASILFYRKNTAGTTGSASGGFREGVMDDTYGAHLEGSELVLCTALGDSRHAVRTMDGGSVEGILPGTYRLVYQATDLRGRTVGDTVVTEDAVSRELALAVCRLDVPAGALTVYTPSRDDAHALVSEAMDGGEPVEYGSSTGLLGVDMCCMRVRHGEVVPGRMCLFGPFQDPDDARRGMDRMFGFHPLEGSWTLRLAVDLGGTDWTIMGPDGVAGIREGDFHTLADVDFAKLGIGDDRRATVVSSEPVSRDIALRICSDRGRLGMLSVYTPLRGDALQLASEASDRRPVEVTVAGRLPRGTSACFTVHGGKWSPRVFHGPLDLSEADGGTDG